LRILFDTSVAIAFRDGAPAIMERAERLSSIALLSTLSVVELEAGVAKGMAGWEHRREALDEMYGFLDVLPFGMGEATRYSVIISEIGFSRPLFIDRLIAAQALVAGALVATLNPRDFRRIPGLQVEDWSVPPA
jgi:tRNA(fMet)-specific endonuclease VapC